MVPSKLEILKLYKELLRYGDTLFFTSKIYYKDRIRKEFVENKFAADKDIEFLYKVSSGLLRVSVNMFKYLKQDLIPSRRKIDKSLVPELNELDLEEKFIKGEGPGGQFVNKRNTCVYLVHKPTGLAVKMGDTREQHRNRKLARMKMVTLLDNLINKEKSVESQRARMYEEKLIKREQKQKKLNEKKQKWKDILAAHTENI